MITDTNNVINQVGSIELVGSMHTSVMMLLQASPVLNLHIKMANNKWMEKNHTQIVTQESCTVQACYCNV